MVQYVAAPSFFGEAYSWWIIMNQYAPVLCWNLLEEHEDIYFIPVLAVKSILLMTAYLFSKKWKVCECMPVVQYSSVSLRERKQSQNLNNAPDWWSNYAVEKLVYLKRLGTLTVHLCWTPNSHFYGSSRCTFPRRFSCKHQDLETGAKTDKSVLCFLSILYSCFVEFFLFSFGIWNGIFIIKIPNSKSISY